MKFRDIKNTLFLHIKNLPGWGTGRKIVVIESDDWGSIRMPSRAVYNKLINAGLDLNGGDGLRYSLYDSLETSSDLELLFEVLSSFKDCNNASAVITANSVVANPDFIKIRENDFQQYYYEPVTDTINKYKGSENIIKFWKEGISNSVFIPQFHGREHLNISVWMNALRKKDSETLQAFNEGMWAFMPKNYTNSGLEYEAAFQLSELSRLEEHIEILEDGIGLFERILGYKPKYFVPPNGRINNMLNLTCYRNGIKYRSASNIQQEPIGNGQNRRVFHWLGQKESNGIRYIIRNCVFEPSDPGKDWVDSCLNEMKIAFRYHKPAIISTHRVNYIGVHETSNRDNGLRELTRLLKTILRIWPDVEFMNADKLGDLIEGKS
jgi:hypothetical protein